MDQSTEARVIEKFREHLARGDLRGVRVINRISGGMPAEGRIEEEFYISGEKKARLRSKATGSPTVETASEIGDAEVRNLFEQLGQGIDSLVPRSVARFVPDSVVGSITIDVEGDHATLYYLVEEEDRQAQGQSLAPEMSQALSSLSKMSGRLRTAKEE